MDERPRRKIGRSTTRHSIKKHILGYYYGHTGLGKRKNIFKGFYTCYICKVGFLYEELTIEHLIPISRGGSLRDVRNLDLACSPCNNFKADMTMDEFIIAHGLASYKFPRRGFRNE